MCVGFGPTACCISTVPGIIVVTVAPGGGGPGGGGPGGG